MTVSYFDTGPRPSGNMAIIRPVIRFAPRPTVPIIFDRSFRDRESDVRPYELNTSIGPSIPEGSSREQERDEYRGADGTSGPIRSPTALPERIRLWTRRGDGRAGGRDDLAQRHAKGRSEHHSCQYSNLTDLTFTQLSANPGDAQLRYALSNEPETAYAYGPDPGDGGDSWYNTTEYTSPHVGNYEWITFIHESGHALGLKHGHEAPALTADRDSLEFSVMTYRGYIGASVAEGSGYTNETFGYPQTLMMYDIAALQRMYGADFTVNSGDTTYSWNSNTGAFSINGSVQWTPGNNRVSRPCGTATARIRTTFRTISPRSKSTFVPASGPRRRRPPIWATATSSAATSPTPRLQ